MNTFPLHDPAKQTFNYICDFSGSTESHFTTAAAKLRDPVRKIRGLYRKPIGGSFPYHDLLFQFAYLVAYFPYYIEPLYHVLTSADLPDSLFDKGNLKTSFFGGGPCPEILGFSTYLRQRAPNLSTVEAAVFDCEPTWKIIQKVLLSNMLQEYASEKTDFTITSNQCNVVKCSASTCPCGVVGSDIIVSQNFLSEVYADRPQAIKTFQGLIQRSGCRYLILIENNYPETKELMNAISRQLHTAGHTKTLIQADSKSIRPNILIPEVLSQYLYADENGLRAKKYVHYHYMVIKIDRANP